MDLLNELEKLPHMKEEKARVWANIEKRLKANKVNGFDNHMPYNEKKRLFDRFNKQSQDNDLKPKM